MTRPETFIAQDYEARVTRHVPGLADLHRMVALLLDERMPEAGEVLVLGAGGGMEMRVLSAFNPGWRLYGIDPSADMLALARKTLAGSASPIRWLEGYIEDADPGPFDAGVCLLTLHFLSREARLETLKQLHARLRPDAPLVVAHHSFPQDQAGQDLWLRRNAALMMSGGVDPDKARAGVEAMKRNLPALSPEEDEAVLREAGFKDPALFYAGFTFKGWVAYR